jgi:hypothetical protein
VPFLLLFVPWVALASPWQFSDTSHTCVAWRTRKRVLFVQTVRPVGVQCAVKASLEPSAKGAQLVLRAALKGFDSGSKDRDQAVLEILHAEQQPDIVIKADLPKGESVKTVFDKKTGALMGTLSFAGKYFPIEIPFEVTAITGTRIFQGFIETTFSRFGIEPPQVAGGAVASVKDELELYYQLREDSLSNLKQH